MNTPDAMRTEAAALLSAAPAAARIPFGDDAQRRHLEYRPQPRPGAPLTVLDPATRKAAHRLLATALRPHAFAQAMTILSLEEVLDRAEGYRRGRHSDDYYVAVFGDPQRDERWGWRFEGHHLSVSMTLDGDTVFPTPLFFGANPNTIAYRDVPVVRPLALEEDLGLELMAELDAGTRAKVVVAAHAPSDIHSGPRARAGVVQPLGLPVADLPPAARAVAGRLTELYTDRLTPGLLAPVDTGTLHFAWQGAIDRSAGHYYRIQGPDLLIEYDNTDNDANHAHTVLRRPVADFGGDPLAAHRAAAH